MHWVYQAELDSYSEQDAIAQALETLPLEQAAETTCHRWLNDSLPKRFIFQRLYGDLLWKTEGLRVLDIGGGLTGFTPEFVKRHDYTLVDPLDHDNKKVAEELVVALSRDFYVCDDWWSYLSGYTGSPWDIVIANDLFPNVDQRLVPFLDTSLTLSKKISVSLTYSNVWRWYRSKRTDADEVLTQMSWDGVFLDKVLRKYSDQIIDPMFSGFEKERSSVYPNGRQVCLVCFDGFA